MELIKVKTDELAEFSRWLQASPYCEVFQSPQWAEFKRDTWRPQYYFLTHQGHRVGAVTVLSRQLPLLKKKLLYLPRGPVLQDYRDKEAWAEFTQAVRKLGQELDAVYIKCDPPIPESPGDSDLQELGYISMKSRQGFGGFEPAATIRLDLSGSEEDVFQRIPKKTRYNIRYPEKYGVTYTHPGVNGLDDFLTILQDTSKRANFFIRTRTYYQKLLEIFGDKAQLTMAYHEGAPVAGGITLVFGDKAYAYSGGQLTSHKHLRAFYGLIWERMKWAKAQGAQVFDLYGIPVDRSETNKLHGLYSFKKSFGGEEVEFIGEYDLPINTPLYQTWKFLSSAQASLARLRRRLRGRLGG